MRKHTPKGLQDHILKHEKVCKLCECECNDCECDMFNGCSKCHHMRSRLKFICGILFYSSDGAEHRCTFNNMARVSKHNHYCISHQAFEGGKQKGLNNLSGK